jgi:hypothetical protein
VTINGVRRTTWATATSTRWRRPLTRVISGGRPGAAQAALFVAQAYRIPTRGQAQSLRTNILDTDGTLWLGCDSAEPEERLCRRILESSGAHVLELRLSNLPPIQEVAEWIVDSGIHALHITGARERHRPPGVLPVCASFFANLFCTLEYFAEPNALAGLGIGPA